MTSYGPFTLNVTQYLQRCLASKRWSASALNSRYLNSYIKFKLIQHISFSASSFCLSFGNVKIVLNNPNPTSSHVYLNLSISDFACQHFHYKEAKKRIFRSSAFVQLVVAC